MRAIFIIIAILFSGVVYSQEMKVYKTDGTVTSYLLSNIDSITFNATPILPIEGLVAYYPFNGNANDESGHGNNGTVSGATLTTDRFGNENKSYGFNGTSNYIQCPDPLTLNSFTIAAWINADDYSDTRKEILNGGKFDITSGGYHLYREHQFCRFDLSNLPGPVSDSIIQAGQWTFIVGISYGNTLELYINGTLKDQSSDYANLVNDILFIGTDATHNSSSFWKGKIDDIRIYNRALSNSEVNQLYHEGGWTK